MSPSLTNPWSGMLQSIHLFVWVELVSKCGSPWNGNKIPVSHSHRKNVFLRISSETVHPAKHPFHPSIQPFIMQTHLPKSGLYFLHDKPNTVLNVLSTSGFPSAGPQYRTLSCGNGNTCHAESESTCPRPRWWSSTVTWQGRNVGHFWVWSGELLDGAKIRPITLEKGLISKIPLKHPFAARHPTKSSSLLVWRPQLE